MGSPWRPNCTHSRGGGPEGVERTSRDLEGAIFYHHFLSDQGPMVSKTICRHVCPESTCHCRRLRRHGFNPWVRKIPWRRKWQPTSVFLPGKSHGQRSLWGQLQSMGLQRVGHDWVSKKKIYIYIFFSRFFWLLVITIYWVEFLVLYSRYVYFKNRFYK